MKQKDSEKESETKEGREKRKNEILEKQRKKRKDEQECYRKVNMDHDCFRGD